MYLLTYQSNKGLEFPYVAVINASFVHSSAADESEVIPVLYKKLLSVNHSENILA